MTATRNAAARAVVLLLAAALPLAGGAAARAAEPAAASPEAVVRSYTEELQAGRYLASTGFMHPEALEKFRGILLPVIEAAGSEGAGLLALFKGVADVPALRKLTPAEFFASFLDGLTAANPSVREALSTGSMTPLGSVAENDLLHVVCRTQVDLQGVKISKMNVVSLKRAGRDWRVLLSGEIEGMAEGLRRALAAADEAAAEPEPPRPNG